MEKIKKTNLTLSFDDSEKQKKGDAGGWLMHAARDVDMKNGVQHRQSNPNINRGHTEDNLTLVYDSRDQAMDLDEREAWLREREKALKEQEEDLRRRKHNLAVEFQKCREQADKEAWEKYLKELDEIRQALKVQYEKDLEAAKKEIEQKCWAECHKEIERIRRAYEVESRLEHVGGSYTPDGRRLPQLSWE